MKKQTAESERLEPTLVFNFVSKKLDFFRRSQAIDFLKDFSSLKKYTLKQINFFFFLIMPLGNQKTSSKNLTQDPRDALGPLVDPVHRSLRELRLC